ncbi:pyrimidine-nucleoside phosphorylase, partial [Staphylococcus pseudintermedius]
EEAFVKLVNEDKVAVLGPKRKFKTGDKKNYAVPGVATAGKNISLISSSLFGKKKSARAGGPAF